MAHNLRNTAMQFCKVKITHSISKLYLYHAQLISEHVDKRCVLSEYTCFLSFVVSNQRALTPAVLGFLFADASHVLVVF